MIEQTYPTCVMCAWPALHGEATNAGVVWRCLECWWAKDDAARLHPIADRPSLHWRHSITEPLV